MRQWGKRNADGSERQRAGRRERGERIGSGWLQRVGEPFASEERRSRLCVWEVVGVIRLGKLVGCVSGVFGAVDGAAPHRHGSGQLIGGLFQHSDEGIQPAPACDGLGREPAVLVATVRLAPGCARRRAAVHATPPVRHRGRAARAPAAGLGSAAGAEVHGREPVHGVGLRLCAHPRPPGA